ncbi:MAG: hydroxylamine oxidoreductase, partial [Desulfobacterales bacterium]
MKKMSLIRTVELLVIFSLVCAVPLTVPAQQTNFPTVKEYRIERSVPPVAVACIECHRATTPGLFADWAKSRHANA